eukprot:gb/GFBE01026289.1/.p1 GENE.gb/GFBE01026289.1/~~gb/GFBE01026289.1/.p1  ORF type:complete len:176 (+),score=29.72 gb/GFBE01026289.1/:1-528(+)
MAKVQGALVLALATCLASAEPATNLRGSSAAAAPDPTPAANQAMAGVQSLSGTMYDVYNSSTGNGRTITCLFGTVCLGEWMSGDVCNGKFACHPGSDQQGDSGARLANFAMQASEVKSQDARDLEKSTRVFGNLMECQCGVVCQWGYSWREGRQVCNGPMMCRSCMTEPAYGVVP